MLVRDPLSSLDLDSAIKIMNSKFTYMAIPQCAVPFWNIKWKWIVIAAERRVELRIGIGRSLWVCLCSLYRETNDLNCKFIL
jgi:hypothetical protein